MGVSMGEVLISAHTAATQGAGAPFLPTQLPPEGQEVDLPSGPHRCLCSVTCGRVTGCSFCHADLVGWQRESRDTIHHQHLPNRGSRGQTHPPCRPPQLLEGCLHHGIHPPTGQERARSPPATC